MVLGNTERVILFLAGIENNTYIHEIILWIWIVEGEKSHLAKASNPFFPGLHLKLIL